MGLRCKTNALPPHVLVLCGGWQVRPLAGLVNCPRHGWLNLHAHSRARSSNWRLSLLGVLGWGLSCMALIKRVDLCPQICNKSLLLGELGVGLLASKLLLQSCNLCSQFFSCLWGS